MPNQDEYLGDFAKEYSDSTNDNLLHTENTSLEEVPASPSENSLINNSNNTIEPSTSTVNIDIPTTVKSASGKPHRKAHKITNSTISKAIEKLDHIAARATQNINTKTTDEFDILGNYVAATVRKLPPLIAAEAELEIHKILHDKKMLALRSAQSEVSTYTELSNVTSPEQYSNSSYQCSGSASNASDESVLHEFINFSEKN